LRLKAANRGIESVENTHNIVSSSIRAAQHTHGRNRGDCRKRYANMGNTVISMPYMKTPRSKTGAELPGGQQLPGRRLQVADGEAG
jgi:hypothetical protein